MVVTLKRVATERVAPQLGQLAASRFSSFVTASFVHDTTGSTTGCIVCTQL